MKRLRRAVEHAKQNKNYKFAVLFLDFDRFKEVNDTLGHLVGDQLLIAIARRLETCLRTTDVVARLGGDEFVILLQGIHETSDALHIADRIQKRLKAPYLLDEHEVNSTVSIGIVLSEKGYDQAEEILQDADEAMYRAKALGKARYELFNAGVNNHREDVRE
jgi:diguanylate cyclase (GGDEF)-like protein